MIISVGPQVLNSQRPRRPVVEVGRPCPIGFKLIMLVTKERGSSADCFTSGRPYRADDAEVHALPGITSDGTYLSPSRS